MTTKFTIRQHSKHHSIKIHIHNLEKWPLKQWYSKDTQP